MAPWLGPGLGTAQVPISAPGGVFPCELGLPVGPAHHTHCSLSPQTPRQSLRGDSTALLCWWPEGRPHHGVNSNSHRKQGYRMLFPFTAATSLGRPVLKGPGQLQTTGSSHCQAKK